MEYLEQKPRRIYKYIRINKAVEWMLNPNGGKLIFKEPNAWEDPTEKAMYEAKLLDKDGNEYRHPKVFASCFTKNIASDASWTVYQHVKVNDTQPRGCIKLSIRFEGLLSQLRKWIKEEEKKGRKFTLYYGNVVYKEWDDIEKVQIPKSSIRQKVFNDSAPIQENFLKLLLLKRKAYEYENELRIFLVLEGGNVNSNELNVPIKWNKCLRKIYYGKDCDPMELSKLNNSLFKNIVEESDLLKEKDKLTIKLPNKLHSYENNL